MSETATLFSLPGEWIDRRGRPRPRFPIRRILVIKPDHIGDMLVADQAVVLLRRFFPDARLELVCGTWNVALARRLGRFDAVHGVDLFHEISAEQSKNGVADEARHRGAEALSASELAYLLASTKRSRKSPNLSPIIPAERERTAAAG